jgi:serine/threonine-protein kinase RsbW
MTSGLRLHRDFAGTYDGAADAAAWLHEIAVAEQLADKLVFALELCLEELFTNVVRHGGVGHGPDGKPVPLGVDVVLKLGEDAVDLVVSDNGTRFDVSHAPSQPVHQPLEEVAAGGLGIQLIRSFSDDIRYEPLPAGNRVIVKFLRQDAVTSGAEA